jgi:hypothetical protein
LKQLLKIAQAFGVETHELLIVEHEEPSAAKLRVMIQELRRRRLGGVAAGLHVVEGSTAVR